MRAGILVRAEEQLSGQVQQAVPDLCCLFTNPTGNGNIPIRVNKRCSLETWDLIEKTKRFLS